MKELIEKIKQKGYWKITIHPIDFKKNHIPNTEECKKIIELSQVSLRGWSYPHIDKNGIKISGNDNIESYCDSEVFGYFEYWRFYQSGQFVHYFSMREDYSLSDEKIKEIQKWHDTKSAHFLSIISTLYTVTEIFEFAQRLASKNVLGSSAEILIELGNCKERELFFWDDFSRDLNRSYICAFRDENILIKRTILKDELISNSDKIALSATVDVFKKFNWSNVPEKILEEDQNKFLQRRL